MCILITSLHGGRRFISAPLYADSSVPDLGLYLCRNLSCRRVLISKVGVPPYSKHVNSSSCWSVSFASVLVLPSAKNVHTQDVLIGFQYSFFALSHKCTCGVTATVSRFWGRHFVSFYGAFCLCICAYCAVFCHREPLWFGTTWQGHMAIILSMPGPDICLQVLVYPGVTWARPCLSTCRP